MHGVCRGFPFQDCFSSLKQQLHGVDTLNDICKMLNTYVVTHIFHAILLLLSNVSNYIYVSTRTFILLLLSFSQLETSWNLEV